MDLQKPQSIWSSRISRNMGLQNLHQEVEGLRNSHKMINRSWSKSLRRIIFLLSLRLQLKCAISLLMMFPRVPYDVLFMLAGTFDGLNEEALRQRGQSSETS